MALLCSFGPISAESRNTWPGMVVPIKKTSLLIMLFGSEITRIMEDQMNRWILVRSWFSGSFHLPWSEWSQITDPDPDHPKGTNPSSITVAQIVHELIASAHFVLANFAILTFSSVSLNIFRYEAIVIDFFWKLALLPFILKGIQ